MKIIFYLHIFIIILGVTSCSKIEKSKKVYISGSIKDNLSAAYLPNIKIQIDAVKSSANGFSSFGKREPVGNFSTDLNGNFSGEINIFQDAEFLNYKVNYDDGPNFKSHYISNYNQYLSSLNGNQLPPINFKLDPLTKLKIEIKNVLPDSESDTFSLVIPGRIINTDNYNNTLQVLIDKWKGRNVWASYYVEVKAEEIIRIYSKCSTNGIVIFKVDSIFSKRDSLNSMLIEY